MNRKTILSHIIELITRFKGEIEANNKLNLTDINIHAENFLIPLLKLIYGWDLKNTNMYSMNSPAIDLEDDEAGVAIQVTSTGTSAKIKKTLVKYKTHHGTGKHDQLIILILTKKQKKYTAEEVINHAQEIDAFDLEKDIIDFDDILKEIQGLHSLDKIKEIQELLQTELSDSKIESRKNILKGIIEESYETYQTNLVRVSFPTKVYRYNIEVNRLDIIRKSWKTRWKLNNKASSSKVFQRAVKFLEDNDIPPYYDHGKQLYTFENIQNSSLHSLCAPGSQTILNANDFAKEDISQEKIIIGLLKKAFTHDLKIKKIAYKYSENIYFFEKDADKENRNISYILEKSASRDVVTPMFRNEDGIPQVYKHLSFVVAFIKSDTEWFMSIRPTWLFTVNGYKLSMYNSEQVSDQKRMENNQHVNNAFEVIRFCLNNKIDADIDSNYSSIINFQAIQPINVKLVV